MTKHLLISLNIFLITLFFGQKSFCQHVYAYITNSGSNTVSIIDVSSNTVIGTVNTGTGTAPYAVTVLPNGNAYIADNGNGTVTVFSTYSNTIIGTIPVGTNPVSIASNSTGTRVYVSNSGDGTVSVINTSTNLVTATITVGGNPSGIVVSPDNSTVYVSDGIAGVAVINTTTNTVTSTISTGASTLPKGVAITPNGQYLYVALSNASPNPLVGVYATSNGSQVATVQVGGGPFGVAVSPDGSKVYVTNSSGSISVIATGSNTVSSTIPDGGGNQPLGVSFTPDGTRAYVVNYGAGNVSVVNATTDAITGPAIIVGSNPTSFSSFIATVPTALAIHFTSFTAQELANHSIQLNWKVQDQTDGTYYEVQGSTDGTSFSKKSLIKANGSFAASYSWIDASASSGTNFYRIKSVEISGKVAYSQTLKISIGSNISQTLIYPNPVKDGAFTLQLNNQPQGLYSLELVNISGQKLFKTEFNYNGGSSAQTVNLPNYISPGSYNLVIRNGSAQTVLKVLVE